MPRGKLITDREREYIAIAYNQNRSAKAEIIRDVASRRCSRELGLSTVQRELAQLRKDNDRGSTDPLDNQWSMASLSQFPIEPKDIPFLLYFQHTFENNIPEVVKQLARKEGRKIPFMTNRIAIWISRFLRLAHTDPRAIEYQEKETPAKPNDSNKWPDWIEHLIHIAMWYSDYEIGCELAHIKPISTIYFDAPTLPLIGHNIQLYNRGVLKKKGIITGEEPDLKERLESMDAEDIVTKGGRGNERPYSKTI